MYKKDLEDIILKKPAKEGCDSLKIITGYTDPGFISRQLIALSDIGEGKRKFFVEMILGMIASNGLKKKTHDHIKRIVNNWKARKNIDFICRYKVKGKDIHSKVYIWFKKKTPQKAFCGSANYSESAFSKRRECMVQCDAHKASQYYDELVSDTLLATDNDIKNKVKFSNRAYLNTEIDNLSLENLSYDKFRKKKPIDTCSVSLLVATGDRVGRKSGLNWGQRKGRRYDEAYIPYNTCDRKPNFFPLKTNKNDKHNPLFKVVADGVSPFFMRIAQGSGKGLQSAEDNAILGRFFRKKLNITTKRPITKKDLEKYGNTHVLFKKYDNDIYLMDFKPNNKD